ncbi:MAG: glycosyltransferase [Desulfovibrio sp.]|jgi:glycosyltransferase involved in cell wall biosynthesis|nr:glycosyltransferase [Desulfovibrio sp.]
MNILLDGHDISLVGGIERFTASLASVMAQRGHNVFLFTYAPEGTRHRFALDPAVKPVHYPFTGDQAHIPGLRRQALACAPDVLISPASYNNHLLWCAMLEGTDIPWVYSERNDPWVIEKERWKQPERRAALCVADRVHMLLDGYADTVPPAARERVRIIPNPVCIQSDGLTGRDGERKILLSVGRLDKSKQNHLLLDAFALLSPAFPLWRLDIWGEGPEQLSLQKQAACLGLRNKARLCGLTLAPEEQYASADIFCIPSRHEGLPNVVIEAMACGLPVVGFAGCPALKGIVRHGETGLLAPDMNAESLALSLRALMENEALRRTMGEKAIQAAQAYRPERIFDAWEALLRETAACKGNTRLRECLAGGAADAELEQHFTVMREILGRKNVLLRDSQWARRIARRHPLLKKALQPFRLAVSRLTGDKT